MGYSYTFKYSEKDLEYIVRNGVFLNYNKFLINEFFNSSDEEFVNVMDLYRKRYGESAFNHVMRNYCWYWRSGNRILTDTQESRIIPLMSELLNEQARAYLNLIKEQTIHKLGIKEVSTGILSTVQFFFQNQRSIYSNKEISNDKDIQSIFKDEIERCERIPLFGHFYALDFNERSELLEVSKYIIKIKLQNQFNQIAKDINTFIPFIKEVERGFITASLNIKGINKTIDLVKIDFQNEIIIPTILINELSTKGRYKEYIDKYLATELVEISNSINKFFANEFLNENDLKLFFDQYKRILKNNNSRKNNKGGF